MLGLYKAEQPHRLQTRANRMWLWAIVTQPVFSFAFAGHDPWYALNILFVFAGATQLLAWYHCFRMRGLAAGLVLLGLSCLMQTLRWNGFMPARQSGMQNILLPVPPCLRQHSAGILWQRGLVIHIIRVAHSFHL